MSNSIQNNTPKPTMKGFYIPRNAVAVEIKEKKSKIITPDESDGSYFSEYQVVKTGGLSEDVPIQPDVGDYIYLMQNAQPLLNVELVNGKKLQVFQVHQVAGVYRNTMTEIEAEA